MPVLHPETRTARDLVTLVATMPTRQLTRELAGDGFGAPVMELIDRALDGDEAAFAELPAHLSDQECAPVVDFLRAPTTWIDKLRGLLADWLVAFEPIEPRIAEIEHRDVELRRADREALAPAELIERTTGGLRWLPEPGIQRVILAPSYFGRPYNNISSGLGLPALRLSGRTRTPSGGPTSWPRRRPCCASTARWAIRRACASCAC